MSTVFDMQRWRERLAPRGYGAPWAWASLFVLPAALILLRLVSRVGPEHYVMAALFLALAWAGPRARRFSLVAGVFTLTGLSYTLLGPVMALRGTVHVSDLWGWEHALFPGPGGLSLSDWLSRHTHPVFDAIAGLTYITYLIEVFLLGTWLFFRGAPERALRLAVTFAVLNVAGWAIWVLWPAAPPWYVDAYGLGPAVLDAAPSAAGAARFDALVGAPVFASFYSRSTSVFGAMPSLHAAYPALATLLAWNFGKGTRVVTALYALVMIFSAVYLRHHYLLDVLAGISLSVLAYHLVGLAFLKRPQAAPTDAPAPEFELEGSPSPSPTP